MTTVPIVMDQIDQVAKRKLQVARAKLLLNHGFFGMLALRLRLVEDNSIPTLAVDGKSMFYNAEFVKALSDSLTSSAVAHEVMHCVFDHMGRRGARSPKKWNYAGDYTINGILEDAGLEIGDTWLNNPIYKNKSTDEIYDALPDDPDDYGGNNNGLGNDVMNTPSSGSASSAKADALDWKIATVQAAAAQKAAGNLPGSLQRFIEEGLKPKVDWKDVLRRYMTQFGKNDYSWSRPNKRFLEAGFYLPSLHSEHMGDIVIGIDTSGSIDQKTLNAFGAQIKAICDSTRPSAVHVVYCDAVVNHVDTFGQNDEIVLTPHGGGGTAFRPVFDYVQEKNLKPECLVYLTDLYGDHNFPEPEYSTIWCCISPVVASFGQTIQIEV